MKTLKKVLAIVLTLCSLTAMLTVGAWADGTVSPNPITLKVGETVNVTATPSYNPYPADKNDVSFSWSCDSVNVQIVDPTAQTAKIKGLAEVSNAPLKCVITYTGKEDPTLTATENAVATVTVNPAVIAVTNVVISGASNISVGATGQLTATVYPETATDKSVVWTSNNTGVVMVNSSGGITGIAAGSANITATASNGVSGTCTVTVSNVLVSSVTVTPANASIMVGDTANLTATVQPVNAGNTNVVWGSSNNAVATVNNGVVTGISAGTATITATAADGSGHSANCTVTVSAPILVDSIALSKTSTELAVGSSETLTVAVAPTNASNKTINWSSNNTAVATVDNGTVRAVSAGTAVITAAAADGSGVSASCTVTVKASAANTFAISETAVNLTAGSTKQLYTRLDSADVTAGTSWSSTNTAVATVVNGKVTAKSAGSATISAIFDVGGTRYTAYSTVTVTGYAVQHQITYGNYSTFDGKNPLYFMTNDLASNFKGVAVDGYTLTNGNQYYATSSPDGHILVALNPAYLKMLSSASAHTIQIGSANGIAQGYFKLYGTSYNIYGVKTGDESNPGLWAALCFMAFLGAAAIVVKRRRDILG